MIHFDFGTRPCANMPSRQVRYSSYRRTDESFDLRPSVSPADPSSDRLSEADGHAVMIVDTATTSTMNDSDRDIVYTPTTSTTDSPGHASPASPVTPRGRIRDIDHGLSRMNLNTPTSSTVSTS